MAIWVDQHGIVTVLDFKVVRQDVHGSSFKARFTHGKVGRTDGPNKNELSRNTRKIPKNAMMRGPRGNSYVVK